MIILWSNVKAKSYFKRTEDLLSLIISESLIQRRFSPCEEIWWTEDWPVAGLRLRTLPDIGLCPHLSIPSPQSLRALVSASEARHGWIIFQASEEKKLIFSQNEDTYWKANHFWQNSPKSCPFCQNLHEENLYIFIILKIWAVRFQKYIFHKKCKIFTHAEALICQGPITPRCRIDASFN